MRARTKRHVLAFLVLSLLSSCDGCRGCDPPKPADLAPPADLVSPADLSCVEQFGSCLAPRVCCPGLDCVGGLCARV